MMLSGDGDCIATKLERPKKALHNFKLSNWGFRKTMRCMKLDGGSRPETSSSFGDGADYQNGRLRSEEKGSEVGIEEFRAKLMSDIRTVKESILREQLLDYEEEDDHTNEEEESEPPREKEREIYPTVETKPWNLRKRREACKAPVIVEEEGVRSKFNLTLSKKEVGDDIMMMGHPPPRRPKKRPRTLQKKINLLYPAFYFGEEVTEDIYY